ncbi:MAG: Lrp/AsnC ligand binding domain-containing protein [Bacteroidota bacterium]
MYTELKNQFDPLDIDIMRELTKDARIPFSQLAQKLKISNSLVHQRVRKLKEAGVLKEAVFLLNADKLGYETCAFVQIMLTHAKHMQDVIVELEKIPEIVECVNIAGRYAIMVKVYAINNYHLRDVVYEKIQGIEGVEGTNTVVSFETPFIRGVPLEIEK